MMSFCFTGPQWEMIGNALIKIGGEPSGHVRCELEGFINRIFVLKNIEKQKADLFRRVCSAATELSDALDRLAEVGKLEAEENKDWLRESILFSDVEQRLFFSNKVKQYADGANWMLHKGLSLPDVYLRGRPPDTSLLNWVRKVLILARLEQWNTHDDRGHTSVAFMDFLMKLAACARSAGLDHSRDIRRALTRAVATARAEEAEELRNRPRLNEALDAVASLNQKMAGV